MSIRTTVRFLMLLALIGPVGSIGAQEKVTYDDHVKPLLRQRCAACHSSSKKSGDLDVTSYLGVMQGGGSGASITPGDVSASYLFSLVNHDEEPYMPPDSPPIPAEEIALLRAWIEQGALENASSKARIPTGPRIAAVEGNATERPATVVVPGHLPLEPVRVVERANAVIAAHTHPWAPIVAVAGSDQVLLYDTRTNEMIGVLPFAEGAINVVRFSRNGALLIAAGGRPGAQGVVAVWDVASGERVATLDEESDAILAADISADHRFVAVGGTNRLVRIYRMSDDRLVHEIKKHTEWVAALEFSPDGILLASADRNGGAFIWEARTAREYLTLAGHPQGITGLSWRWDSNLLASASLDGSVKLWEIENGGQVRNWGAHGGGVQSIEFARDGRIVTAGRDRAVKLWDQAGQQVAGFGGLGEIGTVASFCDESGRMYVGDWAGSLVAVGADGAEQGRVDLIPRRLEERLAAARAEAIRTAEVLAPQATRLQELTDRIALLDGNLATYAKRLGEIDAETAARGAKVAELEQQKNLASTARAEGEAKLPMLVAAVEKGNAVAAAFGQLDEASDDSTVSQLRSAFVEWKAGVEKELTTTREAIAAAEKRMAETTELIVAETTAMTALATERTGLAESQTTTQTERNELETQRAALEPDVTAARTAAETAAAAAARWETELAFVARLAELDAVRRDLESQLEATYAELDPIAEGFSAAGARREAAMTEKGAADAVVAERQAQLVAADQRLAATTAELETGMAKLAAEKLEAAGIDQGLAALAEALAGARKALELMPGDQPLVEAIGRLEMLEKGKQERRAALLASIAATEPTLTALATRKDEEAALVVTARAAVDEAGKLAAEKEAPIAAIDEELAALERTKAEIETRIGELQTRIEEQRLERARLQGLSS